MATILLIDDDVVGVRTRGLLLKAKGYDTLIAQTGAAGVELARQHAIDAVVLDYKLPDTTGEEVLQQLRNANPTLPVIGLSGMLNLPDALKAGASAFVVKGQGAQYLLDALAECLRSRS